MPECHGARATPASSARLRHVHRFTSPNRGRFDTQKPRPAAAMKVAPTLLLAGSRSPHDAIDCCGGRSRLRLSADRHGSPAQRPRGPPGAAAADCRSNRLPTPPLPSSGSYLSIAGESSTRWAIPDNRSIVQHPTKSEGAAPSGRGRLCRAHREHHLPVESRPAGHPAVFNSQTAGSMPCCMRGYHLPAAGLPAAPHAIFNYSSPAPAALPLPQHPSAPRHSSSRNSA